MIVGTMLEYKLPTIKDPDNHKYTITVSAGSASLFSELQDERKLVFYPS